MVTDGSELAMDPICWPAPAWIAAFRREATPATMTAAARCADIELARLQRLQIDLPWDAEDIVQHVLAATLGGNIKWIPGQITLRAHLRDKIQLAARQLRKRKRPDLFATLIDLDHVGDEHPVWADEGLHGEDLERQVELRTLARRAEVEMWQHAKDDPIALSVLAAMPDAATDGDLADATGLTQAAVKAAKQRLRRHAGKLSRALRTDVRDVLAVATPFNHDLDMSRSSDSEA
ncbi:MAG: hypothetical protein IPL61_12625 [Myxococcales bacterium]|nr:hypothetical protein [Myxococcales bacterium]